MKNFNDIDNNDKEKLKYFAEKAKEVINLNINYHKQKEKYENYIREIKSILFDKDNIQANFRKIIIKLKENKDKLQQEYEKIKSLKYDIYYKNCTDELEMGRPLLNQLKSDKFTLEYTLSQKDNMIKVLSINMKNSLYFSLFRQPKRDTFLDIKEGDLTIKEITNQIQSIILKNSKNFNALNEKCKRKKKKIEQLKDKIKQLKEYIYLLKFEKTKINQENYLRSYASNKISNQVNSISNLKTTDRTISTYDTTSAKKILENKENINNNGFKLSNSLGKNYEEDFKFINKKDNVTNAIMSTIIPESLNYLKHSRMKNIKNSEALKNETEFTLNKNYNENKNINYFNNFLTNKALSAENRKTKKIKNKKNIKNDKIIQSFQNLEELFGSSNSENEQEEIIIDTVIHSDDETTLENKIIPKKSLSGTYLQEIQSKIPKINLDLIEFNKLKVFQEIDLYSLQRRNYKNMSVDDNINIIKKKIKKIKNKININSKKA